MTTNSAEVRISVNATTKEKEFNVIQDQILKKLEELSNGQPGNIDSFNMA